jgi:hypothetical protein
MAEATWEGYTMLDQSVSTLIVKSLARSKPEESLERCLATD